MNDKRESKFKVLQGGKKGPSIPSKDTIEDLTQRILTAALFETCSSVLATNTRLMGVVGLKIQYNSDNMNITQLYMLDYEEYGLRDYKVLESASQDEIESNCYALFGALGGKWVELNLEEAFSLIASANRISEKYGFPVPDQCQNICQVIRDYDKKTDIYNSALEKVSIRSKTDAEAINYFLMRLSGKDYDSARQLTTEANSEKEREWLNSYINKLNLITPSTFFKNTIRQISANLYRCQSLIEDDSRYSILISDITTSDGNISCARLESRLDISAWEASMQLRKSDFVSHFMIDCSHEDFATAMRENFKTLNEHSHENGILYMIYNENNDHVNSMDYRLDNDLMASVFFLDSGEVLISSPFPDDTDYIEETIFSGKTIKSIDSTIHFLGHYRFDDKIFAPFMDSGLETFQDFMNFINGR